MSSSPTRRDALLGFLAGGGALLLAGCATPPARTGAAFKPEVQAWSGRLGVTVDSTPPQQFSAGFDLEGNPQRGTLRLTSPLGSTIALLRWEPGSAMLQQSNETQSFDSLDALTRAATGVALPLNALFDWLHGVDTPAPGWHADLNGADRGRIVAQRLQPLPAATLRVILAR